MRAGIVSVMAFLVAGCEAPRVAERFASTPASTQVCSFYIAAAAEAAQAHCKAAGANAELVGSLGQCDFPSGPGREYSFMTARYPTLYNYRCVR